MPSCVCRDAVSMRVYDFLVFQSSFPHQFRIFFRIKKGLTILVHQPGITNLISVKKQRIIKGISENLSALVPFPPVGKLLVFFSLAAVVIPAIEIFLRDLDMTIGDFHDWT